MAVNGFPIYENFYDDKFENYYGRHSSDIPPSVISSQRLRQLNKKTMITTTLTPIIINSSISNVSKLILLKEIELNENSKQISIINSFTYLYWFLVVLAILLAIALAIIFIYYWRNIFKNDETFKKLVSNGSSYWKIKQRIHPQTNYQPNTLQFQSFKTPPCPSKSLESLNYQIQKQSQEIIDSPQVARLYTYRRQESLSTFTSSTSYLPTMLQSRLSTRSFDPAFKIDQLYESQRVNRIVDDEVN